MQLKPYPKVLSFATRRPSVLVVRATHGVGVCCGDREVVYLFGIGEISTVTMDERRGRAVLRCSAQTSGRALKLTGEARRHEGTVGRETSCTMVPTRYVLFPSSSAPPALPTRCFGRGDRHGTTALAAPVRSTV